MERLEFLVETVDLIMRAIRFTYEKLEHIVSDLIKAGTWDRNIPRLYSRIYQTYIDAATA
jgi:hypothetical protein